MYKRTSMHTRTHEQIYMHTHMHMYTPTHTSARGLNLVFNFQHKSYPHTKRFYYFESHQAVISGTKSRGKVRYAHTSSALKRSGDKGFDMPIIRFQKIPSASVLSLQAPLLIPLPFPLDRIRAYSTISGHGRLVTEKHVAISV